MQLVYRYNATIKLWNTLGECKYTIQEQEGHTEVGLCTFNQVDP
jgi:hypothetical protein